MADDVVAASAGTSGAAKTIEWYLLDLAALLADPRRVRASVVAEARDGLQDAVTRHTLWTFLLTGPLVGIWWLLLLAPRPLRTDPGALSAAALSAAVPVLPQLILTRRGRRRRSSAGDPRQPPDR